MEREFTGPATTSPRGAERGNVQAHIQVRGSRDFNNFVFAKTDTTGTEDKIDIVVVVAEL